MVTDLLQPHHRQISIFNMSNLHRTCHRCLYPNHLHHQSESKVDIEEIFFTLNGCNFKLKIRWKTIPKCFYLITESGSNNSRGGSPVKDALPHSPSSSNQTNSHGARLGNKNSSSVASSQNKILSSPHHRETSNNLAKSDLNIVSIIIFGIFQPKT